MEVLYPRCAGLDVHKDTVVACVRCASEPKAREVRTFGTTTRALLELSDWLESFRCTYVGMEATGVYWKPVWHLLEGSFELVLAQCAAHPQRARSQERRQRRDVDRGPAGTRAHPRQLRSARANPGASRSHAYPQAVGARDLSALSAHPEGAGDRERQAGQRPVRRPGSKRPGDAGCHRRGQG